MNVIRLVSFYGKTKLFLSPLVLVFIFGMFSIQGYSQGCNSELAVYKDRDSRSITKNDPTRFQLELTNNGSKAQTYTIVSDDYKGTCMVNGSALRSSATSKLDVFIYQNESRTSTITVPARSTAKFIAMVALPRGAAAKGWQCIEVIANSDYCQNGTVSTILKVYVTDSNDN